MWLPANYVINLQWRDLLGRRHPPNSDTSTPQASHLEQDVTKKKKEVSLHIFPQPHHHPKEKIGGEHLLYIKQCKHDGWCLFRFLLVKSMSLDCLNFRTHLMEKSVILTTWATNRCKKRSNFDIFESPLYKKSVGMPLRK